MLGRTLSLAAVATAVAVSLTPAVALTKHWRAHHAYHYVPHGRHHYAGGHRGYVGAPYFPDAPIIAGVPDRRGCIPQCPRDLNPCDPPAFKMADGRCNPFD